MIKLIFPVLSMILLTTECVSQTRKISGKVVTNYNEEVPGVNVLVKGTTIGTATDVNGEFSLDVPANEKITLLFSAMCPVWERKISEHQNYVKVKIEMDEPPHSIYGMVGPNFNTTASSLGMNYALGYRYMYYRFGLGGEFNYLQNNISSENETDLDYIGIPIIIHQRFVPTMFTAYLGTGYYWTTNNNSSNNDIKLLAGISYERNRFAIDVRYLNGFNQVSDEVHEKSKNLCLGVRYRFR